jgi:23S rRNA (pseudouridine1915-N3)-methyltransferase
MIGKHIAAFGFFVTTPRAEINIRAFIKINNSTKSIVFVIGGAYGFSEKVYQAAASKLSLSDMTFSHQIIRLFFTEQLYRAFTIIKGEPYHNE